MKLRDAKSTFRHRNGHDLPVLPGPLPEKSAKGERKLCSTEKTELEKCEAVVCKRLDAFFEFAAAMMTIKDHRLYRETHSTFEAYCRDRWSIGRSYAWRVIEAGERLQLLPPASDLPRPINEFQMRPYLKLETEAFPAAWKETIKRAKDGKITAKLIKTVVSEMQPKRRGEPDGAKPRRAKKTGKVMLGQVLASLQAARRAVEKSDADAALKALDEIENHLFNLKT